MPIPQTRVAAQRPRRQVRHRVELPPLLREVGERLAPTRQKVQVASALTPYDFRFERFRVALPADHLRARSALLVPPAHAPDSSPLALDPLNAHCRPLLSPTPSSMALKLPRLRSAWTASPARRWRRRSKRLLADPALQLRRLNPEPMAEPRRSQLAPCNRPIDSAAGKPTGTCNLLRRQQPLEVVVGVARAFPLHRLSRKDENCIACRRPYKRPAARRSRAKIGRWTPGEQGVALARNRRVRSVSGGGVGACGTDSGPRGRRRGLPLVRFHVVA